MIRAIVAERCLFMVGVIGARFLGLTSLEYLEFVIAVQRAEIAAESIRIR